jgi:hypothetical protein
LKKPLPQLFSRISIGGRITKHLQMPVNPWDKYLQIQLSIALHVLQIVSGNFIWTFGRKKYGEFVNMVQKVHSLPHERIFPKE